MGVGPRLKFYATGAEAQLSPGLGLYIPKAADHLKLAEPETARQAGRCGT